MIQKTAKTIFKAGSLAASLDIAVAMIRYFVTTGKDPLGVLRFIASGVFGRGAFTGGLSMALLGLIFHFFIAFSWTTLYFFAYPKLTILSYRKYLSGIIYGAVVWCGMNVIVLPLSNIPRSAFDIVKAAEAMGILMICVGIPIAIIVDKHYSSL